MNDEVKKRFWAKVKKSDGCWEWIGVKNDAGYGQFGYKNKRWKAHRFSWSLLFGKIPDGLFVLHKCDNPPCVNPDHLFLGTNLDNVRDCISKGRWPSVKVPKEIIKLLGTMSDENLSKFSGISKRTIFRNRKKLNIKSYGETTGNNGKFNGIGLHPRWKTPLRKAAPLEK